MNDIDEKILANKGLMYKQLQRFNLVRDNEAESLGYEALYNAIKTYDASTGNCFSTYATVCIYNALGSYIRTTHKQRQLTVLSYNNIAGDDMCEFEDFIGAPVDTEDEVLKHEFTRFLKTEIANLYEGITNKQQKLIIKQWLNSGCLDSFTKISNITGVSQPYVSQVIGQFRGRLRKAIKEYSEEV